MALNPRIASIVAIAGLDGIVDALDAGAGAATATGQSGAQPTDPDTATAGTRLFTNVFNATAFGGATDGTGKATANAAAKAPRR